MHPEFARNADLRERFLREAYVANRVDHPGVVPILFDGIATEPGFDGAPFLVMPRLYGRTLEERVAAKGPLSWPQLLHVAEHLLRPLAEAHARGSIHRDVKPANVFLTHGREVKLLDWGIGRAPELSRLTTRGAMMGTLDFMAPEALFGDEIDARADVFSVGATLFLAATGHTIRGGRSGGLGEFLRAVVDAGAALKTAAPALPQPIVAVITKALCFRRGERYADAGTMLEALRRLPR